MDKIIQNNVQHFTKVRLLTEQGWSLIQIRLAFPESKYFIYNFIVNNI